MPLSDLYLPRLVELNKEYAAKEIVFLAIASNRGEDAAKLADYAPKHGASFPVLLDPGNVVADSMLVERTCEALILDGRAVLRYRGAIDDQYTQKARRSARPDATWPTRCSTPCWPDGGSRCRRRRWTAVRSSVSKRRFRRG